MKLKTTVVVLAMLWSVALSELTNSKKPSGKPSLPKIAIIGGGISGASSAHFLQNLFGAEVQLHVYEADKVGGRLATVKVDQREYEAGGSIIHPANAYMVNFTEILGLRHRDKGNGRLGLFDGEGFQFLGSGWPLVEIAQLWWHYGWDIVRINSYVENILKGFHRIYDVQNQGEAFTSVDQLLAAMSFEFPDMLHHSIKSELRSHEFHEPFLDQLVMGGMRSNYGQTTSIHSFVGAVSLAGVQPGLWAVHGGNKLVPEGLLKQAKAKIIKAKVNKVLLNSATASYKYTLDYSISSGSRTEEYDIVIVAAPLYDNIAGLKFENFPHKLPMGDQSFHRTVATFVQGLPNITTFGVSKLGNIPEAILTTNADLFYNSLGKQAAVDFTLDENPAKGASPVWKVFSQKPLSESEINKLFVTYEHIETVDWLAYPKYSSDERRLPSFELHDNLYYTNAIEIAASAMEMMAIAGHNVALLAYNNWNGHTNRIDSIAGQTTFDEKHVQDEL